MLESFRHRREVLKESDRVAEGYREPLLHAIGKDTFGTIWSGFGVPFLAKTRA
jgi:hypothetical protein